MGWCNTPGTPFSPPGGWLKGFESRQSLSFSHVDIGDAFQFILSPSSDVWKRQSAGWRQTADIWLINWNASPTSTCEKDKIWRGANPRPMVLHASALPLPQADLQFLVSYTWHMIYIGRGFAPRQPFIRRVKKRKRWLEGNRRYMIDKLKRVAYVHVWKRQNLARREPTTYGFACQRLTPTPSRPAVSCLLYVTYDLYRSWVRAPPALHQTCENDKALAGGKPPIYDL